MNKAEVRIIEPQQEFQTEPTILDYERNQLLLKYGFTSQPTTKSFNPTSDLSYQELMDLEDKKYMERHNPPQQKITTYSIDPHNVRHNEVRVSSDDGFSLEIRVVSDMNIRH